MYNWKKSTKEKTYSDLLEAWEYNKEWPIGHVHGDGSLMKAILIGILNIPRGQLGKDEQCQGAVEWGNSGKWNKLERNY